MRTWSVVWTLKRGCLAVPERCDEQLELAIERRIFSEEDVPHAQVFRAPDFDPRAREESWSIRSRMRKDVRAERMMEIAGKLRRRAS